MRKTLITLHFLLFLAALVAAHKWTNYWSHPHKCDKTCRILTTPLQGIEKP